MKLVKTVKNVLQTVVILILVLLFVTPVKIPTVKIVLNVRIVNNVKNNA